jgi:uncharacterized protein with NRDE domain
MCTLILGRDVTAPHTVLIAANRDEDVGRPSDSPLVLNESPRVVGGRDQLAGGTWLAVREGPAVVALLNRRGKLPEPGRIRSRGMLTMDLARGPLDPPLTIREGEYAPFSLLYATPRSCRLLVWDGEAQRVIEISPGWHVLTHQELDDPTEPRAAYLVQRLRERPPAPANVEEELVAMLREHGEGGTPPVCLHQGRMVTVSASLVRLAEHGVRYLHAEGRPCEHEFQDQSRLLEITSTRHP